MSKDPVAFEYPIPVRPAFLDVFGHVNNAKYLEMFEEARWDFIEKQNYGLSRIRETALGPVVLEVRLQFKRELKSREACVIRSRMLDYKGKIGRLEQVLLNEKGEDACIAEFVMGLFDVKARKLVEPTDEWLKAIGMA